mgnify:CR=1 FL=1
MRIAILTGGGDVPGLNPCIKALVVHASRLGWDAVGLRRGWGGALNLNPDDPDSVAAHVQDLTVAAVRPIDRQGGTVLHTSRTNPGRVSKSDLPDFLDPPALPEADGRFDCTAHVLRVLEFLKIDAVVAIGGDDTLSYAVRLAHEGVRVMACPKTMDNDVFGTDFCIGFGTAVSRSVELIDALRSPTDSHERIAVIELFGRNSGEMALMSGYLAGADRVVISEVPVDAARLAELIMQDKAANPGNSAVIVVSEGARLEGGEVIESGAPDPYGHRKLGGIGQIIGEDLKRRTGQGIVNQSLAYLMRAGPPVALDRMVASAFGTMTIQALDGGERNLMMSLQAGNYTTVPIDTCVSGKKRVDVDALYDRTAYRANIRQVLGKPLFLY